MPLLSWQDDYEIKLTVNKFYGKILSHDLHKKLVSIDRFDTFKNNLFSKGWPKMFLSETAMNAVKNA